MARKFVTPTHEKLYEDAVAAVSNLYVDGTVDAKTTYDSLKELEGEIHIYLDALDLDLDENSVELPDKDEEI